MSLQVHFQGTTKETPKDRKRGWRGEREERRREGGREERKE